MFKQATIAVGAGVASALLFVISATASLLAMLLAYLTPLPIMIAALGFKQATGAAGALVAAFTVGLTIGPLSGVTYLAILGLPAWWLSYLALLARPGRDGAMEWYPVGKLVLWIAGLAAAPVLAIGAILIVRYGGLEPLTGAMAIRLQAMLGDASLPSGLTYPELVRIVPVAVAASTFVMLTVNLWLAGRVVLTSQRLVRPWPSLADGLLLPRPVAVLFIALVACVVLPDPPRLVAAVLAASLAMAFVFQGLAAAHVVTRGLAVRRLVLAAIYGTFVFLMPWLLALMVLGCLDSLFALRGRRPGPTPPPPTPSRS